MSYQGWSNYPTFAVYTWLSNVEDDWRYLQGKSAREIEDYVTATMPELEGMWADLLQSALDDVNWQEIAEAVSPEDAEDEEEEDNE